MKWKRRDSGHYTAGPYTVEIAEGSGKEAKWYATGPGVDSYWLRKVEAQEAIAEVAKRRIGDGLGCEAVKGDMVVIDDGRLGQIAALLPAWTGVTYLIRLPRGKRLVMFRGEFKVVLP